MQQDRFGHAGWLYLLNDRQQHRPREEVDKERPAARRDGSEYPDFIDLAPPGYTTKIGMEGNGVSQGRGNGS